MKPTLEKLNELFEKNKKEGKKSILAYRIANYASHYEIEEISLICQSIRLLESVRDGVENYVTKEYEKITSCEIICK